MAFCNILKFGAAVAIAIFLHYKDQFLYCLEGEYEFSNNIIFRLLSTYSTVFVEMFFIISGVLFFCVYKDKIQKDYLKFDDFMAKRILRLGPLVIITSIYMYIINLILHIQNEELWCHGTVDILELAIDCLFYGKSIFNQVNAQNGPIWYINVLMLCYVLAFVTTKLSSKLKSNFIYIVPIYFGIMMYYEQDGFGLWNYSVGRGITSFFIGILLGFLMKKMDDMRTEKRYIINCMLVVELFFMGYIFSIGLSGNYHYFFALAIFPELILLLYNCKWVNIVCATKFIRYLGNISFGIYMWNWPIYITFHILIINKILPLDISSTKFIVINFVVHVVVATCSYYLFDKKLCNYIGKKMKIVR